jgi:lysophospholipase L1-like esterase
MSFWRRPLTTPSALVLVALAALAFFGTTSAMAESTTLCTADASGCGVSHVHETSVGKAKLLSSVGTTECNVLFLGDISTTLASPLVISGSFTYTNCELGGGSCTAVEEASPAEIKVLKEAHEKAKVTGEYLVHLTCSGFLDCSYNGVGLKGTAKGPLLSTQENGEVTISEQSLTKETGGFLCPKTAKLDITTTPLSATYIGDPGGGLSSTSTSLSTSLKGGGKEGAEITVAEGSKVKDTATLSGENASKAGGTLTYKVYKDKECKELVTEAGKVTVKEGKVPDSEEKELEAGKEYFWQAEYGGDEMNKASTSTCSKEVLKVKANTSLATKLTGGGKEGEEITVAEGSKVKDTATLSGTNVAGATGTVDYSVYKDKECKELATEAGKGKVEGSKAASSEEKELEAGAVYYWQAKYLGDSLHEESTSTCSKEVLTVKAKVTLATKLSGGGKEGEEITVAEGSKVKDQATLSGTKSSTATGTIKYKVYKDKECKELATNAGEGEVKEGKAPASEEKELEAGKEYFWQAEYGGDSLHEAATSACSKEVLKVKANTSLSTTLSGGGKEGAEITVTEGSKVKDTATLSGTNVAGATGTVDYSVYKDKECKELASEAGKGKVEGSKAASSEEKELEAGAVYYWQAKYLGDSLHEESTSTCSNEVETVKAKTTLSTSLLGADEKGAEITIPVGPVWDSSTLSGTQIATAGGTVTYSVYKDKECKELVANAGEVSVTSSDVPLSEEEELEPGVYYWQAEYGGDSLHEASTSTCSKEILTVKVGTSLTTLLAGEGEKGEEIIVAEGSLLGDSATLSGASASEATGTVEYAVYSDDECKELVIKAGKVTVEEGKVPPSEEEELEPGLYYWQATYSGDSVNDFSQSECGTEIGVVSPPLTTTLSAGEQSGEEVDALEGTEVSDQATLHGAHASEATGTIKYAVYKDNECKELATKAGEGEAKEGKLPASEKKKLEPGTYYWQAVYSGDEKNSPATSTCGSEQVIIKPPNVTKYAALGDSYSSGQGLGLAEYYDETKSAINQCHRSKKSWPALVAEKLYNAAAVVEENEVIKQQPPSFIFRACQGAVPDNIWKAGNEAAASIGGQYPEVAVTPLNQRPVFFNPAQNLWVEKPGGVLSQPPDPNRQIKLVTLTIGGNENSAFREIGEKCVQGLEGYTIGGCQTTIVSKETTALPAVEGKLRTVLKYINRGAPNARIRVPLYPKALNTARRGQIVVASVRDLPILWVNNALDNPTPPAGMPSITAAQSINRFIGKLNLAIEETVARARETDGVPVKVIRKTQDAFRGHQLGDNEPWINGVREPQEESFHPNLCGYKALARRVLQAIGGGTPPADC